MRSRTILARDSAGGCQPAHGLVKRSRLNSTWTCSPVPAGELAPISESAWAQIEEGIAQA
jgi:hypothetical protein